MHTGDDIGDRPQRTVPRLTEDEVEAVYGLGYSLLKAGRHGDALCVLGKLAMVQPYSAKLWHAIGAALHAAGDVPAAAVMMVLSNLLEGATDLSPTTLALLEAAYRQLPQEARS